VGDPAIEVATIEGERVHLHLFVWTGGIKQRYLDVRVAGLEGRHLGHFIDCG
jgi:hypothetical protein